MNRKLWLIPALSLFVFGLWSGVILERMQGGRSLVQMAAAVEPVPAIAQSEVIKQRPKSPAPANDGKLRIICFGAHPDDCEIKAGGAAAMWAAQGHHVKFVSVTNGDIGHWRDAGGPLASAATAEVQQLRRFSASRPKCSTSTTASWCRRWRTAAKITRLIREWKADIVIGPRPNDYHPDHRYTGVLVQDAAYMVTVPFFCPDTPPLEQNPVFLYYPRPLPEAEPVPGRHRRRHRRRRSNRSSTRSSAWNRSSTKGARSVSARPDRRGAESRRAPRSLVRENFTKR